MFSDGHKLNAGQFGPKFWPDIPKSKVEDAYYMYILSQSHRVSEFMHEARNSLILWIFRLDPRGLHNSRSSK